MRASVGGLVLAGLAWAGGTMAAEPAVAIDGTRIVLTPPPGFVRAADFVGLKSRSPGASFNVSESPPGSFAQARSAATRPSELQQRGLTLVDVQFLPEFPYEHALAHATRQERGITIDVWLLVFQHPEVTGTVVASLARIPSPPASAGAMRAALASVRVAPRSTDVLSAQLPFSVDPPARFTYRNALAGRQLIVRETPPPPQGGVGDVTVSVVLLSRDPVKPEERESFARQQIFAIGAVKVETADQPSPVTIAGLPGLEIGGSGVGSAGQARRVYMVVLFAPRAVYTITAVGQPDRFQAALADVKALARSFKPR